MSMRTLRGACGASSLPGARRCIRASSAAPRSSDCDGSNDCTVTVTVDCLQYFGCDMSVDYDVFVSGKNNKIDIRWSSPARRAPSSRANGIALDNSAFQCGPEGKARTSSSARTRTPISASSSTPST